MDSADSSDNPSAKHYKSSQQHSRKQILCAVLLTGVCIGFVAAQHFYMHHQRWEEQVPMKQLQQSAPRSELEGILQRIAPDREVMIAISNYNLILEGMLTTWLEVCCLCWHHPNLLMSHRTSFHQLCHVLCT